MAKQAGAKKAPASKITEEERLRMIAEAAYHRALARAFAAGNPDEDWLAAEAEIDAQLTGKKTKASKAKSAASKAKSAAKPAAKAKSDAKPATKSKSGAKPATKAKAETKAKTKAAGGAKAKSAK
jgi:hypothetical protein